MKRINADSLLVKAMWRKGTVPILKLMKVENGKGRTTNLNQTVTAPMELADGMYERVGKSWIARPDMSADEFPVAPELGKLDRGQIALDPERAQRFFAALRFVSAASSTDASRYVLNSVCLQGDGKAIKMIATDGKRLHVAELFPHTKGKCELIVPTDAVTMIAKLENGEGLGIDFDADIVVISAPGATLTTRRVVGTYPNWQQIVPNGICCGPEYVIDRGIAVTALKELEPMVMAAANAAHGNGSYSVELMLGKDSIGIEVHTTQEVYRKAVTIQATGEGYGMVSFNLGYLLAILGNFPTDKVPMMFAQDGFSPVKFGSDKECAVIMPMRNLHGNGIRDLHREKPSEDPFVTMSAA